MNAYPCSGRQSSGADPVESRRALPVQGIDYLMIANRPGIGNPLLANVTATSVTGPQPGIHRVVIITEINGGAEPQQFPSEELILREGEAFQLDFSVDLPQPAGVVDFISAIAFSLTMTVLPEGVALRLSAPTTITPTWTIGELDLILGGKDIEIEDLP